MATLYSIFLLIVFGLIAWRAGIIVLNIAGFPGALLVMKEKMRSNFLIAVGSIISTLGQSYIYLAYMAFVISWTASRISTYDLPKIPIWIFAFMATIFPVIGFNSAAQHEQRESGSAFTNPQVLAIGLTSFISFVCFFVFVFVPNAMTSLWSWVPFVGK